jgi:CTP-dependent riboflavin kinase
MPLAMNAADGEITFTGLVATGQGLAVSFTTAEWARRLFRDLVDIDPYPGTLNLVIDRPADLAAWTALKARHGLAMPAPDANSCDGRLYRVALSAGAHHQARAAIVLPEVAGYAADQVEIIAPVRLRDALALNDGQRVTVRAVE